MDNSASASASKRDSTTNQGKKVYFAATSSESSSIAIATGIREDDLKLIEVTVQGWAYLSDADKESFQENFLVNKNGWKRWNSYDDEEKIDRIEMLYKTWNAERGREVAENERDVQKRGREGAEASLKTKGFERCTKLDVLTAKNIEVIDKLLESRLSGSNKSSKSGDVPPSKSSMTKTKDHIEIIRNEYSKKILKGAVDKELLEDEMKEDMTEADKETLKTRLDIMKEGLTKAIEKENEKVKDKQREMMTRVDDDLQKLESKECVKKTATRKWNMSVFRDNLANIKDYGVQEVTLNKSIECCVSIYKSQENAMKEGFESNILAALNSLLDPEYVIKKSKPDSFSDGIYGLFKKEDIDDDNQEIEKNKNQKVNQTGKKKETQDPLAEFIIEFKVPGKFPTTHASNYRGSVGLSAVAFNEVVDSRNVVDFMEHPIYETNHCVVRQIRSYLINLSIKYGIICSFEKFVFCFVDSSKILNPIILTDTFDGSSNPFTQIQIGSTVTEASSTVSLTSSLDSSSSITQTISNDAKTWSIYQTILRFVFFIKSENERKANTTEKYYNFVVDNKRDKRGSSKDDENTNEQNTYNSQFNLVSWPEINDGVFLGKGRTGPCFRKFLNGWDCVCKCLFLQKKRDVLDEEFNIYPTKIEFELDREADTYERLKELQGKKIPVLLAYESLLFGSILMIATEYSGETVREDEGLNKKQCKSARKALDDIHKKGVLHGDIKLSNMVLNKYNKNEILFIDFAFAKFQEDFDNKDDWNSAIANETYELEDILSSYTTKNENAILTHRNNGNVCKESKQH